MDAASLLTALLVVYALPPLAWRLSRIDRHVPLVVVQVVAGIALGPAAFGAIAPHLHAALFGHATLDAIGTIATLAVCLFVWTAGLELDLRDVRGNARETLVAAGLAIGAPLLCGTAAAAVLLRAPGWLGAHGTPAQAALGLGMACAVTALPILVLLLDELGMLHGPLGQRALRIASLDDVVIWVVLALILLDPARLGRQVGFLGLFAVAAVGARRALLRLAPADRWPAALVWAVGCAAAAEWAGLHYMVGAFLAGATLDRAWLGDARVGAFRDATLTALMPMFFLNTGLRTGWAVGGATILGAAALLLAAAVGGKVAGLAAAGRLLRWPRGTGTTLGLLLQTKALVMIVFARILVDRGIVSDAAFTALLLMAVASTALTMPAVRLHARRRGATGALAPDAAAYRPDRASAGWVGVDAP